MDKIKRDLKTNKNYQNQVLKDLNSCNKSRIMWAHIISLIFMQCNIMKNRLRGQETTPNLDS